MKKIFALLLVFVLCFSFAACGDKESSNKALTVESIAGKYESRLWFLDAYLTLNSNSTYDSDVYGEKGTFSFLMKNQIELTPRYIESAPTMNANVGCVYDVESWVFKEDVEYGLKFSPDENGMTDQTFEACILNDSIPGSKYNRVFLDLNKDGTFEIILGYRSYSTASKEETFNGTYYSDSSTITLKYEGKDYPLYINKDDSISFVIYDKVS